ncbi:MAG: hypothetical protein GPOALKHO_000324 [Sodalis sp.]|nr:MAG: hypothetical protein GPOALKHO_000324 [Sodalis sp.]
MNILANRRDPGAWRERINPLHGSLLAMASQMAISWSVQCLIGAVLMRNGWLDGYGAPRIIDEWRCGLSS